MSIVKVNKFNLFMFDTDRDKLIHELQKFKYVHFDNLNQSDEFSNMGLDSAAVPEKVVEINEELTKVKYIIDSLSKYDNRPKGLKALKEGKPTFDFTELEKRVANVDYTTLYNDIMELNTRIDFLNRDYESLSEKINELTPWLKLDVPANESISLNNSAILLGTIPKRYLENVENSLLDTKYTYFEIIGEQSSLLCVFIICLKNELGKTESILRNYGFLEVTLSIKDTPAKEVKNIKDRLNVIKNKINEYEKKFQAYSESLSEMELMHDYLINKKLRIASSENFLKIVNVDIIEGYIPEEMTDKFEEIIRKNIRTYYLDIKEVDKDDSQAPILLKNSKFAKAFESLTRMYSLPKYNEIDPTPLLSFFYMLFFGMMIADFGYGLVLFLGSLVALKAFKLTESQQNTMRFFLYGSITTMFWGLVYGSFFSGVIPLPYLLDPSVQFNELLILSIALGVAHVFFALGIKAYMSIRDGDIWGAVFDVGFWYMALGGALVLILASTGTLPESIGQIALIIMIIGMLGILLTNGRDAKTAGGKLGGGLYSLYGIAGYIGDFISYSRLMALGLSGAFIASAVNMMVRMLFDMGFIGIIGGIAVFIVGQAFNIFLSVLSGYVHSIRLTYVEFFGKFYEGGGKAFKSLQSEPKYINLK